MMRTIERFTQSRVYVVLTAVAAVLVWTFHIDHIGIPVVLGLMFLQLSLFRDAMPSVPLLFSGLFMFSRTMGNFEEVPLFLFFTPIAILAGMVVHMIRFRTRFWQGKMVGGIAVMTVAMIASAFNADRVTLYYLFYALIGILYAFIYLFYRNSLAADHVQYLMFTMMWMGFVVASEVLIWFSQTEDILTAIETKAIRLGWGISNYIATYLIMFIPATLYFAKRWKAGFLLLPVAVAQTGMLFLTASRGGILAFAVIAVPLAVFTLKSQRWVQSLLSLVAVAGGIFLVYWVNRDWFAALYERFSRVLLDDSGRWEIYREAITAFLRHPLFGSGLFARIDGNEVYHMYHNTFLHTLATLGIVGFIGLVWQLIVQFAVFFRSKNMAYFIFVISLLGAHLHGMLDNIYYMPQFMILMLIMVAVAENANRLAESAAPSSERMG
jgi:hypothetical protein